MSIVSDRLSRELGAPARRAPRVAVPALQPPAKGQAGPIVHERPAPTDDALTQRLMLWEDLLTLVVDPESPRVWERNRKRAILSYLLERGGFNEDEFWALGRGRRSRLFLACYSRVSRDIPQLEVTAFDLDKVLKERFHQEPLTVGSAWHHGYWRSYFSHAAVTHPANDGLREEFSTAWDIVRKQPAVVFRSREGDRQTALEVLRLDMPMLVGPLPHTDGFTMERAYLEAIGSANPEVDLKTRSLVIVEGDRFLENHAVLRPYAKDMMLRVKHDHLLRLLEEGGPEEALREALRDARIVEIEWCSDLDDVARRFRGHNHDMLLSVYLRYEGGSFWGALEQAVAVDGVAMVHVHAADQKSYELIPKVDAFLKSHLVRARVQLVSAGGDTDTMASAACVYEAVLLGANGGSITDIAGIALLPELVDVYHGAPAAPPLAALGEQALEDLRDQAVNTLTCWQHSILDFLSCMGIDDIQKTSGNTMAITMTDDWVREVDALATPEFGALNAELNARRVASERVPAEVRKTFKVAALLEQLAPDLPLVAAAKTLADQNANYHLENTNRSLTADFLESIYRMSAGGLPQVEDFFVEGDMGPYSLDAIRLKLSRESVAWALGRLHASPQALDYISLATPRGFSRPGAVADGAEVSLRASETGPPLAEFTADAHGGFELEMHDGHAVGAALAGGRSLWVVGRDAELGAQSIELAADGHGGHGHTVMRASKDGAVTLRRDPRGGWVLSGFGFRAPIWHGPVAHASISLGAASEDFLAARIEGNTGLSIVSSGEGGPIRLAADEDWAWQSMQAASGHFGIHADDLRRVRDVEIKINQGAKPGKGGRLSGAKVTPTVSKARNIPVGTDALSPDPKHDVYSIEDMPAEVWLWLLYHNHCGIKITGSNYTKYVAAGMWSNFVVDYLLVDSGLGGSGNYHADSSHVGWPDIFRTILHTHHALVSERVDLDGTGELAPIRDLNGAPFGAGGGTRLFASGGLRGELDMVKVLIAGADGLVEASIGKAVAFGCNQCGNCHLDCPRGGITTKPELTIQNDRQLMRQRFRNWTVLNMVKLAVLMDALNFEIGAIDQAGSVVDPDRLLDDIRKLRGRTDLLEMPEHPARPRSERTEAEHDSCRVGSMTVSEPVTVHAVWEAARQSYNGGNNRGGGIDFAGFAPVALRDKTCMFINTIGPDRAEAMREMLAHFDGCRFFDTTGEEIPPARVLTNFDDFKMPIRERFDHHDGWRAANLREDPGDYYCYFLDLKPEVFKRYGDLLLQSEHWLQRQTKYADIVPGMLYRALDGLFATTQAGTTATETEQLRERLMDFVADVREEYFTALVHILDSRYYRTHETDGAPAGKYAAKRRGHVVSVGEDLGAVKISGWTHTIPEYFDFDRFWARYPGAHDGIELTVRGSTFNSTALHAHSWGMHHRYPTNSPAIDEEGRGNPAGAHPFKAYNVLLKHNGEQVGVDSTAPLLAEFGYVHADESMGPGASCYHGDSTYERKALTDTEYAAYLVDFTRRVLGLPTEDASQIISPITGLDLEAMDNKRRERLKLLATNYVQLTPTGPYKFTILESRRRPLSEIVSAGTGAARRVGFRENMDIKFLRPHEIIASSDTGEGGVHAVANGSEAKIADIMLRVLHQQGVLADSAADLRFNMRPGGNPGRGDHGGVVEVFTAPGSGAVEINNRFGEVVAIERAGARASEATPLAAITRVTNPAWRIRVDFAFHEVDAALREQASSVSYAEAPRAGRPWGPDAELPEAAQTLLEETLAQAHMLTHDDYRYLTELALPAFAGRGDGPRAVALRLLTELRKRLALADLGGKSLASMEYLTDGGRAADGSPEGGIYRVLDAVAPLHEALASGATAFEAQGGGEAGAGRRAGRYGRLTLDTRDDLAPPNDAERDVLVIDFAGFRSESFQIDSASRFVTAAVSRGWKHIVGYDFIGGPRYIGTNLPSHEGAAAEGVVIELYGREFGDFLGALLEGAQIWLYGQGQSHVGMKADSGYLFMLQDTLNTCMYAAHGATINVWNSGSRFAVAGQNKVYLADGKTLAPGFKSIHFGSPNEYAFEYLMSGGDNSLHVVMGLRKPNAKGELSLTPKPYAGKFFMSGAAAGHVYVFDPEVRLDPAQYHGNVLSSISTEEWTQDVGPFIAREVRRRGVPIRIAGEHITVRLEGEWKRWRYDEAFAKLVPIKVAKAAQQQGIAPPALIQIVAE